MKLSLSLVRKTKAIFVAITFSICLLGAVTAQIFIGAPSAVAGTDTYPAPWRPPTAQDSMLDTWREYNRECTSYAAWMLHSVNGYEMPFHDDAVGWGTDAQARGITVNMTPAVGSIFWSKSSDHVAWVEAVNTAAGTITTEDYNSGYPTNPGYWDEHPGIAISSASGYIHFQDIASSPPPAYTGVGNAIYSGGDSMASGTTLLPGYYLASANVQNALIFQTDSNLVLYSGGNTAFWSGTHGANANRLVMQTDGNLVMYRADNSLVWQSFTGGNPGAYAKLQSDGNLVIYSNTNAPLWWTGTGGHANLTYFGSDRLTGGQSITQNQYIRSADGRYALMLQTSGNGVLYSPGYNPLWQTNTVGSGDTFTMQTDGNLVLYALGTPRWWTGTSGSGVYAVVQSDGNFVVYNSANFPLWSSGTGGKI